MNRTAAIVMWILLAVSLALNGVSIYFFLRARDVTSDSVYTAKTLIDKLRQDTLKYDYPISQTIPINTIVPIIEDVTVPISTVVPINTVVSVEVDTGVFGVIPLDIPINGSFPVNVTLPIHVEKNITIATIVPISVTVPIRVPMADTPLAGYLADLSAGLERTGEMLGGPRK